MGSGVLGIKDVENNPGFKVRIRFKGDNLFEDNGNRVTFNNISLVGKALETHIIKSSSGDYGSISPSGNIPVYRGSNKDFLIEPCDNHEISEVIVDGVNVTNQLTMVEGKSAIYNFSEIEKNHSICATFNLDTDIIKEHNDNVVIYPNPARNVVNVASLYEIKRIDIFCIYGQLIKSFESIFSKEFSMNNLYLVNGIYVLKIQTNEGTTTKMLQIIR